MGRFLVLLMACLISAIAASTLSLLWPTPPPDTVDENTRAYNHSGVGGQNKCVGHPTLPHEIILL